MENEAVDMEKDPFKEYLRESESDKAHKGYAWSTAIGLQAVDGLKPSKYLIDTAIQNIEGKITMKEKEWVLDGATVMYGSASELRATLEYDFSQEKDFSYKGLSMDEIIHHLAVFISRLWQIHIFGEGNTRTTEYLELFLRNLLLNEQNELQNRNLHISGLLNGEKMDIQDSKVDIGDRCGSHERHSVPGCTGAGYSALSELEARNQYRYRQSAVRRPGRGVCGIAGTAAGGGSAADRL